MVHRGKVYEEKRRRILLQERLGLGPDVEVGCPDAVIERPVFRAVVRVKACLPRASDVLQEIDAVLLGTGKVLAVVLENGRQQGVVVGVAATVGIRKRNDISPGPAPDCRDGPGGIGVSIVYEGFDDCALLGQGRHLGDIGMIGVPEPLRVSESIDNDQGDLVSLIGRGGPGAEEEKDRDGSDGPNKHWGA